MIYIAKYALIYCKIIWCKLILKLYLALFGGTDHLQQFLSSGTANKSFLKSYGNKENYYLWYLPEIEAMVIAPPIKVT